jgi:hypothetical protein
LQLPILNNPGENKHNDVTNGNWNHVMSNDFRVSDVPATLDYHAPVAKRNETSKGDRSSCGKRQITGLVDTTRITSPVKLMPLRAGRLVSEANHPLTKMDFRCEEIPFYLVWLDGRHHLDSQIHSFVYWWENDPLKGPPISGTS